MFFFKVVAKETLTSEQLQAVASVTVNVTDVNDNNPECSQAVYRETVSENQPEGTSVVQVRRMRDTTMWNKKVFVTSHYSHVWIEIPETNNFVTVETQFYYDLGKSRYQFNSHTIHKKRISIRITWLQYGWLAGTWLVKSRKIEFCRRNGVLCRWTYSCITASLSYKSHWATYN